MYGHREQEAQQAYARLLSRQGLSERACMQREFVLIRLRPYLVGVPNTGNHYRQAVEKFMLGVDPSEVSFVLMTVREFFSFWIRDIKAIAAMSAAKAFDGESSLPLPTPAWLRQQWQTLDDAVLQDDEREVLAAFHLATINKHADPLMITARVRLAKYLLLSLRHVLHKQSLYYRQWVDHQQAFFQAQGIPHLFLSVAREFYEYWRVAGRTQMASQPAAIHLAA
ncbi:MAG TPA: hypothetical protein VGE17_04335 [Methylophilus sp.]